METKTLKVVIAANNALVVNGLRHNLENKFGVSLEITGCYDVRVLLRKINEQTDIVVLDYFFDGNNGEQLREKIHALNRDTSVIMHTTPQQIFYEVNEVLHGMHSGILKGFSHTYASQYQ